MNTDPLLVGVNSVFPNQNSSTAPTAWEEDTDQGAQQGIPSASGPMLTLTKRSNNLPVLPNGAVNPAPGPLRLCHRAEFVKDLALDLFLFDRALDHEVAIRQTIQRLAGANPGECLLAGVLGDGLLGDLARQMAVDGRHRRFQPLVGDVVEHHVEAGQRRHMRDAVAHLARADHADLLDCHRHLVIHRNGAHIAPVHL